MWKRPMHILANGVRALQNYEVSPWQGFAYENNSYNSFLPAENHLLGFFYQRCEERKTNVASLQICQNVIPSLFYPSKNIGTFFLA